MIDVKSKKIDKDFLRQKDDIYVSSKSISIFFCLISNEVI